MVEREQINTLMIDIQNVNGYGLDDGLLATLKDIAQKYCPEEVQKVRQNILPDESLNLTALEATFSQLLAGGSGYGELPYIGDADESLRLRSCATCTMRRRTR